MRDNEKLRKNLFFLDAETDGLYGKFLSIAVIILNSEYEELERLYIPIVRIRRTECVDVCIERLSMYPV